MRYEVEVLTSTIWQPIAGIAVYLAVNALLSSIVPKEAKQDASTRKLKKINTPLNFVAIAHNVLMTLYSGVTCYRTIVFLSDKLTYANLFSESCNGIYHGEMATLSFWFYMSKYYEFMDTWLLLAAGKRPIFLQKYHHIGAVIIMWGFTNCELDMIWIWVAFNSFIHTIMYFYYFLTCLNFRPSWKMLMTTLQLVQFFAGSVIGLPYFLLPCFSGPGFFVFLVNYAYIVFLTGLFVRFFLKEYGFCGCKKSAKIATEKKD